MKPRVVVVTQQMVDEALVRQMAPDGFDVVVTRPDNPDWADSVRRAEYLVGLSTISKKTARLAQAFGMRVHYDDIARLPESA